MEFAEELMIPDTSVSLSDGAIIINGWQSSSDPGSFTGSLLKALSKEYKFSLRTPYGELSDSVRNMIINGTDGKKVKVEYKSQRGVGVYDVEFEGLIRNAERRYRETGSESQKQEYESFMRTTPCKCCNGIV